MLNYWYMSKYSFNQIILKVKPLWMDGLINKLIKVIMYTQTYKHMFMNTYIIFD